MFQNPNQKACNIQRRCSFNFVHILFSQLLWRLPGWEIESVQQSPRRNIFPPCIPVQGKLPTIRLPSASSPRTIIMPPAWYSPRKLPATPPITITGTFSLIFLHMNPGAVTGIAPNINFPAAHGVSDGVARVAVNKNSAVVHGVSQQHPARLPLQRWRHRLNRHPKRFRGHREWITVLPDIPVAIKRWPQQFSNGAVIFCFPQFFVELFVIQICCLNFYHYTTPPNIFLRVSGENDTNAAVFFRVSKSMVSRGIFWRIKEV